MWMEYKEFVEAVKKRMEEEMGEEGSVSINSMEKNNQTRWDGLEIKDRESRVGAVFRLRGLYAAYRKSGMEHTVSYILEMLEKKPDLASWDIPGEWEAVKGRIRLALLNAEWNRELLEGHPSRELLDLAAAYRMELEGMDYSATTFVKRHYLESWALQKGNCGKRLWRTCRGKNIG